MSKKLFGKFFIFLLVVGLLFAVAPTGQAEAATYTDWVAQVPAAPTSADTVRVWINSDTVPGETILVEYKIGETYTKVTGTYDTASYSGATWFADIPAQPAGTTVSYQLITRNEVGTEYLWSGFNWSYTVLPTVVYVDDGFTFETPGWGVTHFATVKEGISAVAAGGTVNVADGTYAELLTITKPLTLLGPNAGIDGTTGTRNPEALITFPEGDNSELSLIHAEANDITVNGFTFTNNQIENTYSGGWDLILVGENIEFVNNRVISQAQRKIAFKIQGPFTNSSDPANNYDGAVVKNNYFESKNTSWSSVIMQGIGATVQYNTMIGGSNGIQIQPYTNTVGGIVSHNNVSGYIMSIWHNFQIGGNGLWTYEHNNVGISIPLTTYYHYGVVGTWGGIRLETQTPHVEIRYNTINGENDDYTLDTGDLLERISLGVVYRSGLYAASQIYVHDNEFVNVDQNVENLTTTLGDLDTVFANNTFEKSAYVENSYLIYTSIQEAIDAAADEDTILVGPGEYAEYVELRTPNITVRSTDGAAVTKIVTPAGTLTTGVKVLANMGTVTFEGFTVKNFTESGIIQGMADKTGTTFHVLNNIVQPYADYLRNGIQVSGDGSTVVGNTVYGKRLTDEWASTGITIANASNVIVRDNTVIGGETGVDNGIGLIAFNNDMTNITVEGNTITDAFDGVALQGNAGTNSISGVSIKSNIISDSSEGVGAYWLTDLTDLLVENNQFNNLVYGGLWIDDSVVGTVTGVDASPNWWGSAVGPDQTSADVDVYILGDPVDPAVYTPWCADAACTSFAPDEDGNVYLSGTISGTGGILIGTPGLTYHLAADTVIQNNSPCFVIEASNTSILAEPGAKCIPTGGSNGIDVAAGLNNITVDGLEIDGTGETTGDGIHFAGTVSNIVLVDNNIHDLGSDGIEFAGDVSEVVEIQGNMFKGNLGLGINNLGANTVDAEYNSWGDVAGPAAGDGVSGLVTSTPFTHADLYVVSSGTPWANQVVTGQNITYTVMANLVNVNAADFYLEYPANLTYVSHTDANALGIDDDVTHDSAKRKLHFIGYSTTGNKTGDLALFSVTFTSNGTVVSAPLSFSYGVTSGFGMVGYESSSNVFVNEMVNGSVTIVTLPTITSTDIQGYYLTGEQRQFSVVLDNPTDGADYAHVYVDYTLTGADMDEISLLEYSVDGGTNWVALGVGPGTTYGEDGLGNVVGYFGKVDDGGFPLAPGASLPTLFRVTFVTREQGATDFPTSYAVSMQLRDADALPTSNLLDELTDTMYVYDKPTITSTDIQGYYLTGEEREFHVTGTNPLTGGNYTNVMYKVTLPNTITTDITNIQYYETYPTTGYVDLTLTQVGPDVVAWFGLADYGGFPMEPSFSDSPSFLVTFATAKEYSVLIEQYDVALEPDRLLVAETFTATAYTPPVISATFPTGPYVAGEPVTVPISITNPSGIPGPFELVLNMPPGTTFTFGGQTYTCTDAGCPPITVTLPIDPASNLVITFDEGWSGDISMNLYDTSWDPDRLLATFTKTGVTVLGAFDVNGTVSMQGRSARAGVPLTLTGTPGTYDATSTSLISNNYVFEDVAEGTYTFTTNQPRYLNITADLGKTLTLTGSRTLNPLWLRGGNAIWWDTENGLPDNVIDEGDLGMVGNGYRDGYAAWNDADVNFDGKVNIQDLALVAGNYDLDSATAYDGWQP